jgi:hypothetical protein
LPLLPPPSLSAWAFLPRRYPVLEVERLRQANLTASEAETRLELLDTQIVMVKEAATLVRQKGWRVRAAVGSLAVAAEVAAWYRALAKRLPGTAPKAYRLLAQVMAAADGCIARSPVEVKGASKEPRKERPLIGNNGEREFPQATALPLTADPAAC